MAFLLGTLGIMAMFCLMGFISDFVLPHYFPQWFGDSQ